MDSTSTNTQTGMWHTAGVDGCGNVIWHHGDSASCRFCNPPTRCNHVCSDHPPADPEGGPTDV